MKYWLLLTAAAGMLAASRAAVADKVVANQPAEIHSKPGEQEHVVLSLKAGQAMTVIATQGRWLKVRVDGRTGWIARSLVDAETDDIPRNTRRHSFVDGRSVIRGFGGTAPEDRGAAAAVPDSHDEPVVHDDDVHSGDRPRRQLGVDSAALRAEAASDADAVGTLHRGDALFVQRSSGDWSLVENDEGDAGWVPSSALAATSGGRDVEVHAGVGYVNLGQSTTTVGGMPGVPDNYSLHSGAYLLALGGGLGIRRGNDWTLRGDFDYRGVKSQSGIAYMDVSSPFWMHIIDARVAAIYDVHRNIGMTIGARIGYHYQLFGIHDVGDFAGNPARLPSEITQGVTLGALLATPKLTPTIGVRLAADALVVGAFQQTTNLEDGLKPSVFMLWLTGAASYSLNPTTNLELSYQLTYAGISWAELAPDSVRGHTGTSTSRSDLDHAITLGVARRF